jgi:hypothetical protein
MPTYIVIVGVVVLLSGVLFVLQMVYPSEPVSPVTKENISVDTPREQPVSDMVVPVYADGTYTTSFAYEIPYGYTEPMEVSLVFKNGVITDAQVTLSAENPTSKEYQNWFMEYYEEEVVGQLVDVVSLSRVGGASLTNNAFDVALGVAKAKASGQEVTTPAIVPMQLPTYQRTEDFENITIQDGVYTVENAYFVMAGLFEPMYTTVTLDDGIITDVTVSFDTRDMQSEYYQKSFLDTYTAVVVGSDITDIPFSRIGGASLTTAGFNDALQQVVRQASKM